MRASLTTLFGAVGTVAAVPPAAERLDSPQENDAPERIQGEVVAVSRRGSLLPRWQASSSAPGFGPRGASVRVYRAS